MAAVNWSMKKMAMAMAMAMASLTHHPNKVATGYRQCLAMKFNKNPKFGICLAAPAAPPPSEVAPSGGTPPPEEERPNPVMNFVRSINKEYGDITKMNKLIKSFEAYPKFWNIVVGVFTIGYGVVDQNKENLQKLKSVAVKNRAYLLAIAVLIAAAAFISTNKKGGPKAGAGKRDFTKQNESTGSPESA